MTDRSNETLLESPLEKQLDNPMWSSLTTDHAHLATGAQVGHGLARRYPATVGPLSAFEEPTAEAYADLALLIPKDDIAAMFLERKAELPEGWELLRDGTLVQMICREVPEARPIAGELVDLGPDDYPEMLTLATLTEPGPFRAETGSLGGFLGIRINGRLAAMAGRRLAPAGFREISAVCTNPDFRGRGYALALVAASARNIFAEGLTPFLTSYEANTGAIRVYEQVGFEIRRRFELAFVKPPATS
jgi:ribosomal protein S18 acetylase RimI-like enzyme